MIIKRKTKPGRLGLDSQWGRNGSESVPIEMSCEETDGSSRNLRSIHVRGRERRMPEK